MERVKPPRALFVNFPLGRPCGKPHDVELQRRIVREALTLLESATTPGIITDFGCKWPDPFDWESHERELAAMLRKEGWTAPDWKPE